MGVHVQHETDARLTQSQRRQLAKQAAKLAEQAANGVPGAAEQACAIMRQLAADRRLTVGA